MVFELRQELQGHTSDVRCVCVLKSDGTTIVTGSRDRSVRLWRLGANAQYEAGPVNFDHPHWVNAVESLNIGFATGCHDHIVRLFDDSGTMFASLGGHTGPVSSLSLIDDGTGTKLASGSWDGSARIWDINTKTCIRVLGNHENIVCVLGLPNGMLATGSTGIQQGNAVVGFRVRLFGPNGTEPISVLEPHEGPIRCLARCSGSSSVSFASASNDGSLVLYSESGAFVNKLINPPGFEGGPAFNFCVRDLAQEEGKLIAACDDCCARVWDSAAGSVIQELEHPSTVWWVTSLPNSDICSASGDGVVRLFTSDPIRSCPDESIIAAFNENARISRESQRKKISPGVDVSKLEKIQNAAPGTSEQQVKMFNKDGTAYAYQWSAVMGTWIEVGPVVSGPEEGKTELDGEYYDRVVPVEIQDERSASGGMMKLKLGFNYTDNPYTIASAFIRKHELPDHYTEEIVQFINQQKSSSAPTITQQAFSGPVSNQPTSAAAAPSIEPKRSKYFPLHDAIGIHFEKGSAEKAIAKIKELNAATAVLSDRELADLDGILAILKATSRYHATEFTDAQISVLTIKLLNAWGLNDRFAVFDLIRAVLVHPDGGEKFSGRRGEQFFAQACTAASSPGASNPLVVTSLRAACNMFKSRASVQAAVTALSDPALNPLDAIASSQICSERDANVRSAVGTLFFNAANAVYHVKQRNDRHLAILSQCVRGVVALLSAQPGVEDEGGIRAVSALGCVGMLESAFIKDISPSLVSAPKLASIWAEVDEFARISKFLK